MKIEELVGNETVKQTLKHIKNPSHAYLFCGEEGIGKFLFAKAFAKKWLCNGEQKPCETCKPCLQIENGNHPDFAIIDPIENSIKIEQIREMISKVQEKPIVSERKIYIINNADSMTTEAQNSLLKILEEPPQYIMIILIGANESRFLATIKSRCIKIQFQKIEDKLLKEYLEKKENFTNITPQMLKLYDGSIGKALQLKEKQDIYINVNTLVEQLEKIDQIELLKKANTIYEDKTETVRVLEYINVLLYQKAMENRKYVDCIEKVNHTIIRIKRNSNIEMNIDNLLLNIWEEVNN